MDIHSKDSQLRETENELQKSGITFYIRFVGSVVVEKSLNSLPIERQTEVTREFIRLVVDEAGPSRDEFAQMRPNVHTNNDEMAQYLRGPVNVQNAVVMMNVSTRNIILIDASSSRTLHRFLIPDVSVLSLGSEAEMSSLFCFVAKVTEKGGRVRKCFVFMANDRSVLLEVRDAIFLTFRLSANNAREEAKTPVPSSTPPTPICTDLGSQSVAFDFPEQQNVFELRHFPSLSSDIPPEVPPRPKRTKPNSTPSSNRFTEVSFGLDNCRWFHGTMAREEAEMFVRENGHFLVRKSPNNDEFILVGMNDGERRHVYLVGEEGKIATTIGEFKSIVALIDYFHGQRKPLVLGAVELMLLKPINRINK